MLTYPDFGRLAKNKSAVINFLETMPILKNGDRSIILEPDLFEIRPMPDPDITPARSYWNLIPVDDWDAQDAAPENNQLFFSDICEYSIGGMDSYLENECKLQELSRWIVYNVIADPEIKSRVQSSLYDERNDEDTYEIVLSSLWGVILSLIVYGETDSFTGGVEGDEYKLYCKIRKAYCAGGYPYGWVGNYPDKVKLLVHFN